MNTKFKTVQSEASPEKLEKFEANRIKREEQLKQELLAAFPNDPDSYNKAFLWETTTMADFVNGLRPTDNHSNIMTMLSKALGNMLMCTRRELIILKEGADSQPEVEGTMDYDIAEFVNQCRWINDGGLRDQMVNCAHSEAAITLTPEDAYALSQLLMTTAITIQAMRSNMDEMIEERAVENMLTHLLAGLGADQAGDPEATNPEATNPAGTPPANTH